MTWGGELAHVGEPNLNTICSSLKPQNRITIENKTINFTTASPANQTQ